MHPAVAYPANLRKPPENAAKSPAAPASWLKSAAIKRIFKSPGGAALALGGRVFGLLHRLQIRDPLHLVDRGAKARAEPQGGADHDPPRKPAEGPEASEGPSTLPAFQALPGRAERGERGLRLARAAKRICMAHLGKRTSGIGGAAGIVVPRIASLEQAARCAVGCCSIKSKDCVKRFEAPKMQRDLAPEWSAWRLVRTFRTSGDEKGDSRAPF